MCSSDLLRASPGDQIAIARRIHEIDSARTESQPRSRTGGSTFVNPPGHKAWELIDKTQRSPQEDEEMLRLSMASHWHWTQRKDYGPTNASMTILWTSMGFCMPSLLGLTQ